MKLRFGIDDAALDRIRASLEATCEEPPVGRRRSDVYLDTPDDALAARGAALRYRRRTAIGTAGTGRPWRRQEIRARDGAPLGKLRVERLAQRLDATFSVRIERWTWRLAGKWASVSLDQGEVSTGVATERFTELRIVCRRTRADAAMRVAVGLGATRLTSTRVRDRGRALLASAGSPG